MSVWYFQIYCFKLNIKIGRWVIYFLIDTYQICSYLSTNFNFSSMSFNGIMIDDQLNLWSNLIPRSYQIINNMFAILLWNIRTTCEISNGCTVQVRHNLYKHRPPNINNVSKKHKPNNWKPAQTSKRCSKQRTCTNIEKQRRTVH